MKKVRLGVIGVGSMASGVHLPNIAKARDVELTAVCDVIKAWAGRAACRNPPELH
jgi:predicted dehydrogenase